jgi:vacuolar-type H+-ATPase subunit I/STV1
MAEEHLAETEVDINEVLAELRDGIDKVSKLTESLEVEPPALPEENAEQLIQSIAAQLASLREAAGLPGEDAAQLEQKIRRRQRELA